MGKISLFVGLSFIVILSACGNPGANPQPASTSPALTLPATWTPSPTATAQPAFTEIPTFTPVPAFTPLAYPTADSFAEILQKFQESLFSPNGQWAAYREPNRLRVVNAETTQVWTLPCDLFKECRALLPVKWSRNSQFFYFAPAPSLSGYPNSMTLFSAFARIDVRSGKWEVLLPDSDRYYDVTFSRNDEYLAYTQSAGELVDNPSVSLGIFRIKNLRDQQIATLRNESYAGNIVWSPFRNRIVFQTRNAEGSSIVYSDLDLNVVRYILRDEPADFYISAWGRNNLVSLQKTDWVTRAKTDWLLNPFTNELTQAR
jgi:WD40 repeat protein